MQGVCRVSGVMVGGGAGRAGTQSSIGSSTVGAVVLALFRYMSSLLSDRQSSPSSGILCNTFFFSAVAQMGQISEDGEDSKTGVI